MENNDPAREPLQEQQQSPNDKDQTAVNDANQDQSSLASDGPISKSEGTDSPDLTDESAENNEDTIGQDVNETKSNGTDSDQKTQQAGALDAGNENNIQQ
jgi:hypothetical protein